MSQSIFMKKISTHDLKYTLRDIHKNTDSRRFCFVLGAGASRNSGIPTGGELAIKWFGELKERLDEDQFSYFKVVQNINENDLASSYGSIYRKRFEHDKTTGYEFLVQAMKSAKPSFGHIVLAQILSRTSGHCVLTTNFDSLVESSVYQFTNKTPLVCGHESLSGYARPSPTHPLIVKIHRDLLLSPQSDPDEINQLNPGWKEPLDHIFSTHIPVVIGYGGNDGSLMYYFENMNKPTNFFWCGIDENKTTNRIKDLIEFHEGSFVKIEGFDELMHELLWAFDEIKPIDEELSVITNERILIATKQLEVIKVKSEMDRIEINMKELSALEYADIIDKEQDFVKRKNIYLEALQKYPKTGWLWWRFTYFLNFEKKEYDRLDEYYKKALEFNKNEAGFLDNYANFLTQIKKEYIKAEEYYLKSLEIDPNNAKTNLNFANFLKEIKKDFNKAEEYYLKSLLIDSNNVNTNGSYALFLFRTKRDYLKAEEYFLKALSIDPNNANNNGNYALFLYEIKKEYLKAEEYFLKALLIDPDSANKNGNYANFLKEIKKDNLKANEYYLKSLNLDPNNVNINGNYAQFLLEKGEIKHAQKYIQISFDLNDNDENGILIELLFYQYAHFPEFLSEAENRIEELLQKGVCSIGWNFEGNIAQALKDKHPNPEKLKEFARRITTE